MSASTLTGRAVLRLRPRSVAALAVSSVIGLLAYGWPFLVDGASELGGHATDAPYIFLTLLPLVVAVVLAELAEGGMDAKAVAMLGVLAAVGSALRALSPGTGGFEPTFFVVLLGGRVFGAGFGFALGSLVIVASALVTGGVGPWMPFQMLGLAWVGLFAGCLPRTRRGELLVLAGYAVLASLLFGLLINLSAWPFAMSLPAGMAPEPGAGPATNVQNYLTFWLATSLGWDVIRAVVNAALVLVAGRPVLATLRRAARRAAFEAPVRFEPAIPRPVRPAEQSRGPSVRDVPVE
ncbi:MAG TPA: ECF transporter S component [Actinopolymorphaceae bacterium]